MKQQHSFVTRSIRTMVRDHEDLPAIHAGFLVFSFLAAALFRLGFFGLLILVRMVLDIVKGRDIERRSWLATMEGVIRGSLADISLLACGLGIALLFHPSMIASATVAGLPLAIFTVSRGIGLTLLKLKILIDFLHVFFHMEKHLRTKNKLIGRSLTFPERASIVLLLCSLILLVMLPVFLPLTWGEYVLLILEECVPWRL